MTFAHALDMTTVQRGRPWAACLPVHCAEHVRHRRGPALSLARIQGGLGDALFNDAVQRKNRTLFAALKSLPLEERGDEPGAPSSPGRLSDVATHCPSTWN
jgi:hypothetical protein